MILRVLAWARRAAWAWVALVSLWSAFASSPAAAQLRLDDPAPTSTNLPIYTGCYDIFLSPRQTRETYLIDACTGNSWIRIDISDQSAWQLIPREDHPGNTETLSAIKHYKLISSGLAARDTFLLNTLNGAVWQLFEGADGTVFWGAMAREPVPE